MRADDSDDAGPSLAEQLDTASRHKYKVFSLNSTVAKDPAFFF
jgi:hypothetical protein